MTLRINVTSVFVDDQSKALAFYTETLGFVKKAHIPMGEADWITVVSPHELDGIELLLEPSDHPAVGPFKEALFNDGIPYASFAVSDVTAECKRLLQAGVRFVEPPTVDAGITTAVFDDTCGNLIEIASSD